MANINQISPDGGTTVYDIEDPTARSGVNSLTPRVGIAEGKITTLQEQMLSVQDDLDGLGTASTKNAISVVTDSSDLVESGAVKDIVGWGNKNFIGWKIGYAYSSTDGSMVTNANCMISELIPVSQGDKFIGSKKVALSNTNDKMMFRTYNSDKELITTTPVLANTELSNTVTIGSGVAYIGVLQFHYGENISKEWADTNEIMFRRADILDPTYEPYHASVEESLAEKCDNSVIGTVEDGTNPTKSYAVGEHMARGGRFCTVTVPVTTSSTWTLGSNYVEGTIADNLVKQEAFTITTTVSGLANLTNQNSRIVLRIDSANSKICFPYRTTSGTNNIIVFNNDMTVAANLEVTGTYYYI